MSLPVLIPKESPHTPRMLAGVCELALFLFVQQAGKHVHVQLRIIVPRRGLKCNKLVATFA